MELCINVFCCWSWKLSSKISFFSVYKCCLSNIERGYQGNKRYFFSFFMGVNVFREIQKEIIFIEEGIEDKVCFIFYEISVFQKVKEDVIFIREEI